ncbi:MAG: flagellar type III secretion system pore protein FliP [Deltaproteobacteria bacterium]|nr:flagellar type III secretion system pore protein FliP [Deltaproteobacteria bacterium]
MKTFLVLFFSFMIILSPMMVSAKVKGSENKDIFPALFTGEAKSLINVVIVLSILVFLPSVLLLMTSFTRIVIVLSLLRQAIGIHQLPPNQVIIGLSLFLTFFIMSPTYEKIHSEALSPYMKNQISHEEFFSRSKEHLGAFMLKFTKEKDLALFLQAKKAPRPANEKEIPFSVLVPAFALSELKRAFQMGFLIYIPFLIVDMVVASVLVSAGMMMLPPIFISLPFKLMLFVLVDGWNLLVASILKSFY